MAATEPQVHVFGSPVFAGRVPNSDPLLDTRQRLEWAISDGCDDDLTAEINRALVLRHGPALTARNEDGRSLLEMAESCDWMAGQKARYISHALAIVGSSSVPALSSASSSTNAGGKKRARDEEDDVEMEVGASDPAVVWNVDIRHQQLNAG
jgi:hypothetical protein